MAINGINGSGFNPYAPNIGSRPNVTGPAAPATSPARTGDASRTSTEAPVNSQRSVADAIKSDAAARAATVNSAEAPDGVDQDLWSVLTKDERSYFVKAGAMGPLTYGRFSSAQGTTQAPLVRGGRLDIKA